MACQQPKCRAALLKRSFDQAFIDLRRRIDRHNNRLLPAQKSSHIAQIGIS
jgi:hypothetical protein